MKGIAMDKPAINPTEEFFRDRDRRASENLNNERLRKATYDFLLEIVHTNYTANFSWLGRPIIQTPQDMFALQEIIWSQKPDFVIETGIAHGGSIIFYASMLELVGKGKVIGIDIDIRKYNREAIEKHPLFKRVEMIEGSSIDPGIVEEVRQRIKGSRNVIVCLDSNHTHDHVLKELELYTPFIGKGGYCVVFDTGVEDLPREMIVNRPWGPGNSPKTAVWEFLKRNNRFEINKSIQSMLLITSAPDGYLRCVKD
jgi:cephalosporin hydroxylase